MKATTIITHVMVVALILAFCVALKCVPYLEWPVL